MLGGDGRDPLILECGRVEFEGPLPAGEELGAVMLFLTAEITTLPLWIFRLMGQYRFEQAYAVGSLLLGLMVAIFWMFSLLSRSQFVPLFKVRHKPVLVR